MFGFRVFNTVIMDGSSNFDCNEITGIMDMITGRIFGKTKCRVLDKDHPTMKVFSRYTTVRRYHNARREIEKFYPGMCSWDVTI